MNLLADPNYVLDLVSRHHGIPVEEIVGSNQTRQIAWARMVAMYVLREKGGRTLVDVGQVFHRDHSTVCSNVQKVGRRLRVESVERERMADVLADVCEPNVLLVEVSDALKDARAVVRRLEGLLEALEQQSGHRIGRIA